MNDPISQPEPNPILRRWLGRALAIAVVVAIIFLLCGSSAITVIAFAITDIPTVGLWMFAGVGFGALFVRRSGSLLNCVTRCALGIGAMGLIFHVLGLGGLLGRGSVIGVVVAGAALEILRWYSWHGRPARDSARKHGLEARATGMPWGNHFWDLIPWIIFAIPLGIAVVCTSIAPGFLWNPLDPHPYDVMSYHLQIPREWYDAGRIVPLTHNAFSYFPMLMETHYLAAMHVMGGPWQGMYLCQFITLAHGALMVIAVAAILLELNVSYVVAWSAAAIVAGLPWTLMLSTVCYVEAGVMLYTLLAVGWILVAIRDNKGFANAGMFAGLACGMKYTAFAMTLAPACVALLSIGLFRKNQTWIKGAALTGLIAMAVASPWLIRNIAWTGNPVFPLMTSVFGRAHFTENQVNRYLIAHRPPPAEALVAARLSSGWSRTFVDPQFGFLLFPAVLIITAINARRINVATSLLLLIVTMMLGVWLFATHVMPRFITPMIPLAALLIGLGVHSLSRTARIAIIVLAGLQMVVGLAWTMQQMQPTLEIVRQGLFRAPDLSIIEDPQITNARATGRRVALIGEARAFQFVMPSNQLMYRSVFDVNIPPGTSLEDGWLGRSPQSLDDEGYLVIINRDELNRLARTYKHLTQAPAANGSFTNPRINAEK